MATAERRFLFVDVGRPGVLCDSSVYSATELKGDIDYRTWLVETAKLQIANVPESPYLMGDCAFTLDKSMIKSSSQAKNHCKPSVEN